MVIDIASKICHNYQASLRLLQCGTPWNRPGNSAKMVLTIAVKEAFGFENDEEILGVLKKIYIPPPRKTLLYFVFTRKVSTVIFL